MNAANPLETAYDYGRLLPRDLGLPAKFALFRRPQKQALEWLMETCTHQIRAACLPTGAGKTAIAVGYGQMLKGKTVHLCATKELQHQVHADFESIGMVDIRGRANFPCENYRNCDEGQESKCSLSGTTGCPYTVQVERAAQSSLVVTNYAYWLHSGGVKSRAFQGTELLVCDEAHGIESQLSGYASVKIYASEFSRFRHPFFPRDGRMAQMDQKEQDDWREWATKTIKRCKVHDEDEKDLADRCNRIIKMNPNWIWQFDDRGHCTFEPIRLREFSRGLFASVPRVLLMSASLNEFTLRLLLPQDVEYDFRSWNSVFPPQNAPVYHIPTVKLNWRSTDEDYQTLIKTADKVISSRLDRKGILHTVSYARARRALQHSIHSRLFVWNEGANTLATSLECFRRSVAGGPQSILVTPSVAAGFDFPGEQAEYQIVLKFPFPNETQRVIKERCTQIPGYRLWNAAQEVVQMAGRARRYESDRCETFILDNAVRQLTGPEGKSYCPPGFRIFTVAQVPKAPPKINSN